MSDLLETKFRNLPKNLILVYKAKYNLTINISIEYGLVNGSEVILNYFTCDKQNIKKLNDNSFALHDIPLYLVMQVINRKDMNRNSIMGFDKNTYPILPFTSYAYFQLPKNYKRSQITRTHFPITLGYSFTVHKSQCKTLNTSIIDLSIPPYFKIDDSYAYVALTRLRNLKDLYILREFDFTIINGKIDKDLLIEEERLKKLAKKTLLNLDFKNLHLNNN